MINTLKFIVCIMGFFSWHSHADGTIDGKITELAIDRIYNEAKVFVHVSGNKESSPSCHTNSSWSFALPLNTELDKSIFSMLLTARATQEIIRLEGRGLCDVHASIETLSYIKY